MARDISRSILLLLFALVICCLLYPLVLWAIGQVACPFEANGSMIKGPDGKVVGSRHRPAFHERRVFPAEALITVL